MAEPQALLPGLRSYTHLSRRISNPPNYPHKLTKAAERWLGGGAASGGSELHGVTPAALRSLRITRQSRRLPCRSAARRLRRLLQLRVGVRRTARDSQ